MTCGFLMYALSEVSVLKHLKLLFLEKSVQFEHIWTWAHHENGHNDLHPKQFFFVKVTKNKQKTVNDKTEIKKNTQNC